MLTPINFITFCLDPRTGVPVMVWCESGGTRRFLLWGRADEASAVFDPSPRGINGAVSGLIDALGGDIIDAQLLAVDAAGTVRAALRVRQAGADVVLAMPAHLAAGVALRVGAPVQVNDDVLTQVSAHVDAAEASAARARQARTDEAARMSTAERWGQMLSHLGTLPVEHPSA